jgi:GT2 family glycosyltransferase
MITDSLHTLNRRIVAIVLTYDQREDTLRALQSLQQAGYPRLAIVLVDNGSSDGTVEAVAQSFPDVHVLRHETNQGAAAGRNAGMEFSEAHLEYDFMLFMDNDCVATEGFLEPMVDALTNADSVGLASAKLHKLLEPGIIDDGGGCKINFYTGSSERRGSGEPDHGQYDRPTDPGHIPNTGCLLMTRAALRAADRFDTNLDPYGYEDLDFSLRAMKQGHVFMFVPEALVYHKGNKTGFGSYTADYAKIKGRNLRRFLRKHATPWQRFCFGLFLPMLAARTIVREVSRGNYSAPWHLMWALLKR